MPKAFLFVKQRSSLLPPIHMLDVCRKMASDDIMILVDQTSADLNPMVFNTEGPMDLTVTFENDCEK